MANFESAQIGSNQTAEERDRLRNQLDWENRRFNQPSAPSVTIGGKVSSVVMDGSGNAVSAGTSDVVTAVASPYRADRVIIGGVETSREAAIAAGLIKPETPLGFKQPAAQTPPAGSSALDNGAVMAGGLDRQTLQQLHGAGDQRQPAEAPKAAAGDDGTTGRQAAADAASQTLEGIAQRYGSHVVDAGLSEAVESGSLPGTEQLPEGVTQEHVERVVAGYVAVADDMLSEVGASVALLTETLSADELREARRATLAGDNLKLQHYGRQAVERLASLPTRDPAGFADMVQNMRPDERKALRQTPNGDWKVSLPDGREMSFGTAVRQRVVRI